MAATDTVLWMRVLDRRCGPKPPKLIVIDPRATSTAKEADIHLAPRVGTNVALLNGILCLLIQNGWIDREFIDAHTVGFEQLQKVVTQYPPQRAAQISGVPVDQIEAAARIIAEAKSLVSTCLQGVYQSNQATAAAVQVNNINLVRGMIGRPGCGVLQMNGQPTAQNTRETGADGDLPGFRNWDNPKHVEELAQLWNVEASTIPHWAPPTHALQIFRYCETGSIRMLWIQKTGCFTNVDRTVHISHKAVEPRGEAKSDLDIFLDFSRRMSFRDKDGAPLIKWDTPEQAFEAWKACTRGRPCDYAGLSYEKLSHGDGIAWPCNEAHPEGEHWPYKELVFPTDAEYCETFGHDLITGGTISPEFGPTTLQGGPF